MVQIKQKSPAKKVDLGKKAPANDHNQPQAQKPEAKNRVALVAAMTLLLCSTFLFMKAAEKKAASNIQVQDMSELGEDSERFGSGEQPIEYYLQPELSSIEQHFCRGYQQAASCEDKPRHPIVEAKKYYGMEVSEEKTEPTRRFSDIEIIPRLKKLFN